MRSILIKLLVLMFCCASGVSWGMSPIIPLNISFDRDIFLDEALRDPTLLKSGKISDELGFQQVTEELRTNVAELAQARKTRRADLLEQVYLDYQRISYFFEDLKANRVSVTSKPRNIDAKINEVRKAAQNYATQFIRVAYNKRKKARAIYHFLTNRYLMTSIKGKSVDELKGIRGDLSPYLKRRVDFLEGIYLVEYKRKKDGVKILNRTLRSMPLLPAIGARIVIARHLAGLDYKGRRIAKKDSSYKSYTQAVSNKVRKLGMEDRSLVMKHLVAIWRRAEGSKETWNQVPFRLAFFNNQIESMAIVERAAIDQLKQKKYKLAGIRKYEAIAKDRSVIPYAKAIDLRIIGLYEDHYDGLSDITKMQAIYENYEKKYQPDKSMLANVHRKYTNRIKRSIALAKSRRASRRDRDQTITAVYRFLPGSQESEKIALESEVASIYELMKEHKKAASIYISLKQKSDGASSYKYLLKGIENQSIVAHWPRKAPWNGIRKGHAEERRLLLSLTKEKFERTRGWADLAQYGLILVNLNRGTEAFALFQSQLEKQAKGYHAAHAAGLIALTYSNAKRWNDLEKTARFLITTSLKPRYRGKTYNSHRLLADALFYGGKSYYDQNKWAESATKLGEFVEVYKSDRRRPEGLFFLGLAYHNSGAHPESIKTYLALATEYPGSNFEKQALLLGGKWSIPMAFEDQTIYFYQTFVNRYNTDPQAIEVRATLKDLYLGRELYGDATRIMQRDVNDIRIPIYDRINSALDIVDTEERYGEEKHARWGVRKLKKLAYADDNAKAKVLAFETRIAAQKKDYNKLRRLEREFRKISPQNREAIEGLAQVRFILANNAVKATKNEFYNLQVSDPAAVLDKQRSLFRKMKGTFDRVCDIGVSSYCAPAMIQLAEATKYTLDAIEDVSVPQTLDQATVDNFESKKYDFVTYVDEVANAAIEKALGLTEDGQNTPEWSRQILWDTENDWSYEQASSNTGSGFVQWRAISQPVVKTDFGVDLGDSEW